jgi:hypothetical protein
LTTPGHQLIELLASAKSRAWVVAPFVKLHAFERAISAIPESVALTCITRWQPTEIAAGVSDIDVWRIVATRKNSQLLLLRHLHAKYYCADDAALVGSANVTGAALGWSKWPNVELLIESPRLDTFEASVLASAVPVTEEMYQRMKSLASRIDVGGLPPSESDILDVANKVDEAKAQSTAVEEAAHWIPSTRNPEDLYLAYSQRDRGIAESLPDSVWLDIEHIRAPLGLDRPAFEAFVAAALTQSTVFREVEAHLTSPRRFGYMRTVIRGLLSRWSIERDSTHVWQTLMRWLTHFLPEDFEIFVVNYSEIIRRRTRDHN